MVSNAGSIPSACAKHQHNDQHRVTALVGSMISSKTSSTIISKSSSMLVNIESSMAGRKSSARSGTPWVDEYKPHDQHSMDSNVDGPSTACTCVTIHELTAACVFCARSGTVEVGTPALC